MTLTTFGQLQDFFNNHYVAGLTLHLERAEAEDFAVLNYGPLQFKIPVDGISVP